MDDIIANIEAEASISGEVEVTPTPVGPVVRDVKVDGTSVVSNDVAEIDLTGKQDAFTIGANLKLVNGVLSVDTANAVEQDNTKPVTSAAVHVEIGNIEALLAAL